MEQDIARTLPYAICDRHGPAASAIAPPHSTPPSSTADKRKLSPRRARNFARNLPPGLEQRVTVLEKLIIFCTQAEEEAREGRGVGGRFMQSVSSTLNNDFYRCPCRRRAAMPSGQVYELFLSFHTPQPPPPPPPLSMPAQELDSLTVVAKLCRLIKLLYSLERKLSACLIWSSPDGERERHGDRAGGGCINKRFPGQQASFVCVCPCHGKCLMK